MSLRDWIKGDKLTMKQVLNPNDTDDKNMKTLFGGGVVCKSKRGLIIEEQRDESTKQETNVLNEDT